MTLPKLGASKLVTAWLAVMVTASLVGAVDGGSLARWLALEPRRILHGEVWRLVTWVLIEYGLFTAGLTCVAIWKLGGELAAPWGDARLRRYVLSLVVLGGCAGSLAAYAFGNPASALDGGFGVIDALVIAWLRKFPHGTLTFWGAVELRGTARIPVVIGINVLFALMLGFANFTPELAICAGAVLWPD